MIKLNELVNNIKEYKLTAYMNDARNKYNIQSFINSAFGMGTSEGQKRVVVDHPEDPTKVLKIGCTEDGIWDNACENAMYQTLLRYHQTNTPFNSTGEVITTSDLSLFPGCCTYNNDPFILVADKVYTAETLPEYAEWKAKDAPNLYSTKVLTDGYLWTAFLLSYRDPITQNYILKADIERAMYILSAMSIHSDIGFESPFNKGVRKDASGTLRACILDLGSCLPIFNDAQRPNCYHCSDNSGKLIPISMSNIGNQHNITEVVSYRAIYGCTNPACSHAINTVINQYNSKRQVDPELLDVNVFNTFINDIRYKSAMYPDYIKLLYLDSGLANVPIGMDKNQFYQYLCQFIPQEIITSDNAKFHAAYENYVFKTIATLINVSFSTNAQMSPLANIILNEARNIQMINSGSLNYSTYKNNITQALAQYGITGQNIVCKISSITYLSCIINFFKSQNLPVNFYQYYEVNSPEAFVQLLPNYYQMYGNDLVNLFQHLHV